MKMKVIEIYDEIKNNKQYDAVIICVNGSFIHIVLENIVYIEARPALPKASRCTIIVEKKENNEAKVKYYIPNHNVDYLYFE